MVELCGGVTVGYHPRSGCARVVLEAEPGDVAIVHVLTVHRAGHNYTARGRLRRGPSVILPPAFSFIWRIPIRGTNGSDE